jgi:hypothetical protein
MPGRYGIKSPRFPPHGGKSPKSLNLLVTKKPVVHRVEKTTKEYVNGFRVRNRRQVEVAKNLNKQRWSVVMLIWSVEVGRPRIVYFDFELFRLRWGQNLSQLVEQLQFMTCHLDRLDGLKTGWTAMMGTPEMQRCIEFYDWFTREEWKADKMSPLQEINGHWTPNIKRTIEVRRLAYTR